MLSLLLALAAQSLSAADLRPGGFYVAGVQQGMSLAEYNALIANGGFRSQPVRPDSYAATINGQSVVVIFCQGRVVGALAEYTSSDWLRAIQAVEAAGFKLGQATVMVEDNELRTGALAFAATVPKGFAYGVMPQIKAASLRGHDAPIFQLYFQDVKDPCLPPQ